MPKFSKRKQTLQEQSKSAWWRAFSVCMPFFINQNDLRFEEASIEPFIQKKMQHGTAKHSKEYKDPFTPTIKNNWTDSLDSLLKLKPYGDPNVIIENGHTPLSLAVDEHDPAKDKDKTDVIRILLEYNADPNMRTEFNDHAPLTLAAHSKHTLIVKILLNNPKTNVNLSTSNGSTPLTFATEVGAIDIVQLLLDKGADPNIAQSDNTTPLMVAAKNGDKEIATLLLGKHASIDVTSENSGYTALMEAISEGHEEVIELLLAAGSNPNIIASITPDEKISPLIQSIKNGYHEIAKTLLKYGADPTLLNNLALFYAMQQKSDATLVTLLLERGADPNKFERTSLSPLMLAIINYSMPSFYVLLNNETTDVNKAKIDGTTALMLAVEIGDLVMVKALARHKKIEIDKEKTTDGSTALILAVQRGNLEMVKILIAKGACILKADDKGISATMLADELKLREICNFLFPLWEKARRENLNMQSLKEISLHE